MRKANLETHQACRSLLQKVVRRGNIHLAKQVAEHLHAIGDGNWLRKRTAIIAFEECWPLGGSFSAIRDLASTVEVLTRIANSVKVKDAAGLGTLAYVLSKGDQSVLSGDSDDRHVKVVAEAIRRPADFWIWAAAEASTDQQVSVLESAQSTFRKGGWPWDRAFLLAATYIAVREGVPEIRNAAQTSKPFPFWVALDKHTPLGREALHAAAKMLNLPARQVLWASFYFESAAVNSATESLWWAKEVRWRLQRVGLDYETGTSLWYKVKPTVIQLVEQESENLQWHICGGDEGKQLKLF